MGSLIFGSIGSTLLGPIGGFIGSAIGSMIDQYLFAPSPEDVHGPRLSDLRSTSADPGAPIPLVFGADRVAGIVAHTTELIETVHKERVGGKGGGKKQTVYTYTYHVDIDYLLAEGPILGVGRIWADGRIVRGTWYQMQLDTEENFEKIGGIPYEDWYWDSIFDPATVPWSYSATYTPTIENQKYAWSNAGGFMPISDSEVEFLLNQTKVVVYHYDTASEKYLPIPESHDYTGARLPNSSTIIVEKKKVVIPPFRVDRDSGTATITSSGTIEVGVANASAAQEALRAVSPTIAFLADNKDVGYVQSENVVLSRTASMKASAIATSDDNAGIFSGDFGISSLVQYELSTDTGGSTSAESFSVSTPGVDATDGGASVQHPPKDEDEIGLVIPDEASKVYYELTGVRDLLFYGHAVAVAGSVEVITKSRTPGPPIRDWPDYYNFYDAINDWSPKSILQFSGSVGMAFYRGTHDQISDPTMALHREDGKVPAYVGRAHIVFQRMELEDFGNRIPQLTFEVVQSDDARIRNVITTLMSKAGMDPAHYDLSALPDVGTPSYVMGYTIGTITSYRAAMEPLIDAFEVDAAEVGNTLLFRPRKRVADVTIDYNDLSAVTAGDELQTPVRLTARNTIEMPRTLSIRFKDPEREYSPSTAIFSRQVGPSLQDSAVELPVVRPPHIMKEFTRDKMRNVWLERVSAAWTLPQKYTHISPSDIVAIEGSPDGIYDMTFKVSQVTRRDDGILEMDGVRQSNSLYVPVEGEEENNGTDNEWGSGHVDAPLAATRHYMLDLPPLRKLDDYAGFYIAMSGNANNWPGGAVYELDAEDTWTEFYVNAASARGGVLYDVPSEFNTQNNLHAVDLTTKLRIMLYNPEDIINSVNDAGFFNLENVAVFGKEIIAFKNATPIGDGEWELDTFMRARLGTSWYAEMHEVGELFIILDPNEIDVQEDELSNYNVERNFASATFDAGIPAVADAESFINTLMRFRPYPPAMGHMEYSETATNGFFGITISWVRQNRIDFDVLDGQDIPNSEDFEKYQIDIIDKTTETVIRQFAVEDVTEVEYSSAMRQEDDVVRSNLRVAIYQMSNVVGRGLPTYLEYKP